MLSLVIWCACIFLEALILLRCVHSRSFARYPYFCTYIACTLIVEATRFFVYTQHPSSYRNAYWVLQFLTLLVGYGVILEIIRKALGPYPGAERFARISVLAVFAAVFSFVTLQSMTSPDWSPATCYGEMERDLRAVQVLILASILTVISYYQVLLGKNLKGIIQGYGLYIASSVISTALRSYAGTPFEGAWRVIQPYTYFVSLSLWTVALWKYYPNPAPEIPARLESDYESVALKTRALLGEMRSYLERTVRP